MISRGSPKLTTDPDGGASLPLVQWREGTEIREARWRSEGAAPPPRRIEVAGDATRAAVAFRQACEGTSLVYRGDYRNAQQLLHAMSRKLEERPPRPGGDLRAAFQAHRQFQSTVHQVLSRLLVTLDGQYALELRSAQRVREACLEVWGPADDGCVVSLRQLMGMIGAHEWRKKGVEVAALGGRVHPHYGVFAPIRGEYVDLVAHAPLAPPPALAFDLGTGTGVLALLLARRGVTEVVATDNDPRAVACARENLARFRLERRVRVEERDLFPEGQAPLVVFNPPWIPAQPRTPVERAIYDPGSSLLLRFLQELPEHLAPEGEAWLVLSNLAELLGLRPRGLVAQAASAANLTICGQLSTPARHPRSQDRADPLYAARSCELTVLYRLRHRGAAGAGS